MTPLRCLVSSFRGPEAVCFTLHGYGEAAVVVFVGGALGIFKGNGLAVVEEVAFGGYLDPGLCHFGAVGTGAASLRVPGVCVQWGSG